MVGRALLLLCCALVAGASPSKVCPIAPFSGNYSSLHATAPVPGLEPVRIEEWMVEATRRKIKRNGVDTQLQCIVVSDGVMKRMVAPNIFIAGWSRSGTSSLKAGLKFLPSTRRRRLEGMFFNTMAGGADPYTTYLMKDYASRLRATERPRGAHVRCDDANFTCTAGAVPNVAPATIDQNSTESYVFLDKTPEYYRMVEAMMTIHYASPRARIVLSTRDPWNWLARIKANEREAYAASSWNHYRRLLGSAGCPATPGADVATWRSRGCSFVAGPFDKRAMRSRHQPLNESKVLSDIEFFFMHTHYIYAVELYQRLFGPGNVFVLRLERCLGVPVCGPKLAAFLGLDASLVSPDPYDSFRNQGTGTQNIAKQKASTQDICDDHVNETIRALRFTDEMIEDLLFHERLLHTFLNWSWPWDNVAACGASPTPTPSPVGKPVGRADLDALDAGALKALVLDLEAERDALKDERDALLCQIGDAPQPAHCK